MGVRRCKGAGLIRFAEYTLDPVQGLRRGGNEIRLTPKSLSLLLALTRRAGDVVLKEELFQSVWRDAVVSDSALASCIQEVRKALEDDARHPRFVETVHRRGYRFVGSTHESAGDVSREVFRPPADDTPVVGRAAVVDELVRAHAHAESGARQVWFVSGTAGVGKSTVVRATLARLAGARVRIAVGQCVEQYGAGEPYQPLLEALTRLCRQPGGERVVSSLERYAPTWLAQLAGVVEPQRHAALLRTVSGGTRERMLRELTNALEAIAEDVTLVLCLEDLHWSDAPTFDWIASFAQRPEPTRMLIVGTLRPSAGEDEPAVAARIDALRTRGVCSIITLTPLDEQAVVEYVQQRFPGIGERDAIARLARRVHAHSSGHPLYVVSILADLIGRQVLTRLGDRWTLRRDADTVDLGVSDDIRRSIERRADRLPDEHRRVLEVASVAGTVFSAAVVAAGIARDPNDVEAALNHLVRHQQFVHEAGLVEWPGGAVSTRFAFDHALYREVVYRRIAAARRVELHRRIAARQEQAWGDRAPQIAAELAMHFDRGRDARQAVRYLQYAARNARGRHAFSEARAHFDRALALLETWPPGADRIEEEITARIGLGASIMATHGFGSPEAEDTYSRARALCQAAGDTPRLFPALWGLWLFYWGRGAVAPAADLARELTSRAAVSGDDALRLQALHASWATAFSQGDLAAAYESAAEGMRIYDVQRHAGMAATYGSHDAGVCARMFAARALVLLGREDEALRCGDEAVALAETLEHPFSLALALTFRAAVDQSRGDAPGARRHAARAMTIARDQAFRLMLAWCSAIHAWSSVEADAGAISEIAQSIGSARESGSDQFLPHLLGMHADACLRRQRTAEGLSSVEEALAIVERTGERFYEAELCRLRGELLSAPDGADRVVEESLGRAIEVAERQGAALLAGRAVSSLQRRRMA